MRLFLASSNLGKLREYRELAGDLAVELDAFSDVSKIPAFDEAAPTFAENAAGKAIYYSRFSAEIILADDSGLVVPALNGAPGVHSARYAGANASDEDRIQKLLREMRGKSGDEKRARFVCITAIARRGRLLAIASDFAQGVLTEESRGDNGFGYDPIFLFEELNRTYAELTRTQKNLYSHRGKAFRKLLSLVNAV
ncbi:MAG TPA: RdgB/HAM1 family non-canonical purine NTP pyrophosphatase [Candidatus Sulfotelmatobacter sp.]|nr:RdgB/HAM1 family non-canonical purine NTP pyrophosphatase [Candidatus Sulfotelmatobacter sp.]